MPYAGAIAVKDFDTWRGGHEDWDYCTYIGQCYWNGLDYSRVIVNEHIYFCSLSG
jgi:hypothetical protein